MAGEGEGDEIASTVREASAEEVVDEICRALDEEWEVGEE